MLVAGYAWALIAPEVRNGLVNDRKSHGVLIGGTGVTAGFVAKAGFAAERAQSLVARTRAPLGDAVLLTSPNPHSALTSAWLILDGAHRGGRFPVSLTEVT